jgi:hypothetical protein
MTLSPLWRAFWLAVVATALGTGLILALEPRLSQIELLPDQGAAWYYWKLPEPTFWSRATAWGFYLAHQLFFWGLIWWGQTHREALRDRAKLHTVNVIGLLGTAAFGALHYLQTAVWYDGLAQDVSVFSSQASVVILLVAVLVIEAPRRGLFFGKGGSWLASARQVLIRTHGYYFAWAVTYTFWFHPMETTWGHLLGFFYTFLLMVQGALAFTRVHTNKWWTLVLEVSVLVHGVTVALVAGQEFWPMFFFGFSGIFVVTQMHGLGWSRLVRGAILVVWLVGIVWVYQGRGWEYLNEVVRIPVIDYVLVALLGGLVLGWRRLRRA